MTVDVIEDANKKKIPGTGCYDGAQKSLIRVKKMGTVIGRDGDK